MAAACQLSRRCAPIGPRLHLNRSLVLSVRGVRTQARPESTTQRWSPPSSCSPPPTRCATRPRPNERARLVTRSVNRSRAGAVSETTPAFVLVVFGAVPVPRDPLHPPATSASTHGNAVLVRNPLPITRVCHLYSAPTLPGQEPRNLALRRVRRGKPLSSNTQSQRVARVTLSRKSWIGSER